MSYGKRLTYLRKKKNLSQQDLSEILSLNRSTYARYEREHTQPDFETLRKLADFFDVSVDFILGRSDDPRMYTRPDGQIAIVVDKIDKLMDHSKYKNLDREMYDLLKLFSSRLLDGLEKNEISVEDAAQECNVSKEYINSLIYQPNKLPGTVTLYKLADLIGVTPDYLSGFANDKNGHDPRTPKPKDMQEFLKKEEVMLFGDILDDEDKEKLNNVLAAVFLDAKKRNKRK